MALTDKKEAFAQYYAEHLNGPAAYRHAYDVGPLTTQKCVASRASELIRDSEISERINELREQSLKTLPVILRLAETAAAQLTIATADRDEFALRRIGSCRHCWGYNHAYQWKTFEYEQAMKDAIRDGTNIPDPGGGFDYRLKRDPNPDCPSCEGVGQTYSMPIDTSKLSPAGQLIFEGIKETKDGPEYKLASRHAAWDMFAKLAGYLSDKERPNFTQVNNIQINAKIDTMDPNEAARFYIEAMQNKMLTGPSNST